MEPKITIKYADSCNKMIRVHDVLPYEYHAEDKTVTITFERDTFKYLAILASEDSAIAKNLKKGVEATPEKVAAIKASARKHLIDHEYGGNFSAKDTSTITDALVNEFKKQNIHF